MLYIDGKQNYVQIKGVKVKLGMKPQKREFFRFLRESGQNLKFSAFTQFALLAQTRPLAPHCQWHCHCTGSATLNRGVMHVNIYC